MLPSVLGIVPADALELGDGLVPTAGRWERETGTARFTPRFPAVSGTVFALVGRQDAGEGWRELATLMAPGEPRIATTVVETIDPRVLSIPANLLRFSITFSSPMEEGTAAARVRLRGTDGVELPGALLGMPPELWDRDRRRLTVLLEPGRIKRGLQPHVQAGAPLQEGETVTILVDSAIRDINGTELAAAAERTYRVGAAIRSRIDPGEWNVTWPADAEGQIVVEFGRALDRALTARYLRVVDEHAQPVPGSAALDETSTRWVFTPRTVDDSSEWSLRVDARLEDLAGNSVRRVFDRDLRLVDDDGIDESLVVLRPSTAGRQP